MLPGLQALRLSLLRAERQGHSASHEPHRLSPKSAALQGVIMAEPEGSHWMLRR